MKLRRIFAGMAASAIAMSTMSIAASASDAYIGAIMGYKNSTVVDDNTGEPYADGDNGAQFFDTGEDVNPQGLKFKNAEVDLVNGGTYTISVQAPEESGFNATNTFTVLGVYIKDAAGVNDIDNGQKNVAGAVDEDEGDVDEQIPVEVSIDKIAFDGNEVTGFDWNANYGAYVMDDQLKIELVNIWNGDISDNDLMDEAKKTTSKLGAPQKEIEITFTVKPRTDGNGGDNSSSNSSTDSSTAGNDSSSTSSTGSTTSTTGTTKTGTNNAGGTQAAAGGSDATDTQAATGATAGLVFAGIALAGAAVVISKRK